MSMENSMEKEVKILVQTANENGYYIDLYVVNLEADRVTKLGDDVSFKATPFSSMVGLGDVIYIVDGIQSSFLPNIHSKVFRIDLANFDEGWKELSPYKARDKGDLPCVTLNNKIYLFGTCFLSDDRVFTPCAGEVYDPVFDHWQFLPVSDDCSYDGDEIDYPVLVDSKNNRIIVKSKKSIYAYYPDQRKWDCLVEGFGFWPRLTVLYRDMLLFHNAEAQTPIMAFDLVTKKSLKPVFSPDSPYSPYHFKPLLTTEFDAFFSLGGDGTFCFAVYDYNLPETSIFFLKFRLQRIGSGNPLFTFISYHNLCVPSACHVYNYLPIVEMPKRKDTSEDVSSTFANSSVKEEHLTWTNAMDEVLVDGLIEQAKLGNRVDGTFTTSAYDNIFMELKKKFPHKDMTKLKFTNHLKKMRKKFTLWYKVFKQGLSGFSWDPITCTWDAEPAIWDKLIEERPMASKLRSKKFPFYHKFVEVYGKDRATSDNAHIAVDMRDKMFDDSSFENWGENAIKVGTHPDYHATQNSSKRAKDKAKAIDINSDGVKGSLWCTEDFSLKPAAKLMNSSHISIDLSSIWTFLEEMEVGEDIARAFPFLTKDLDSLKVLHLCPFQKRKEVLKILMQPS